MVFNFSKKKTGTTFSCAQTECSKKRKRPKLYKKAIVPINEHNLPFYSAVEVIPNVC